MAKNTGSTTTPGEEPQAPRQSQALYNQGAKQVQQRAAETERYGDAMQAKVQEGEQAAKARGLGIEPGKKPAGSKQPPRSERVKPEEESDTARKLEKARKASQLMERTGQGMQAAGKGAEVAGKGTEMAGKGAEMAGKGMEAAGKGMQAAGKGAQVAGKGMTTAGQGMVKGGAALSGTGAGAIAGVPMMIAGGATVGAGAATQAGGAGMQAAGKGMQAAGKGAQAAGKGAQTAGQGLANIGEQINTAGQKTSQTGKNLQSEIGKARKALKSINGDVAGGAKEVATQTGQQLTSIILKQSWLEVIPTYGLTILYLNFHFIAKYFASSRYFCEFGEEWTYKLEKLKAVPGGGMAIGTAKVGLKYGEIVLLILVDVLIALALLILIIIMMLPIILVAAIVSALFSWLKSLIP